MVTHVPVLHRFGKSPRGIMILCGQWMLVIILMTERIIEKVSACIQSISR